MFPIIIQPRFGGRTILLHCIMYDVRRTGRPQCGVRLILGRCCRKVALIDAGHPRNAASGGMHGYLSRDGTPPGEFLQTNREQLQKYPGVECFSGTATNCQRLEDGFEVHSGEGGLFRSKLLLLATGLVDPLPPVEGVEAFYGKTIHHSNKSN